MIWGENPDNRAASEIIGVVLLFGLVAAGTVIVVLSGGALKEDLSQQSRMDSAEVSMQELDENMATLARQGGDDPVHRFTVTDRGAERVSLETGDTMRISVNGGACSATLDLDAITYDVGKGGSLTYQAGGVWKRTESGLSVASPPSVSFRNGTLDMGVTTFRGQVDDEFTARKNVRASRKLSRNAKSKLFDGDCRRPDSVVFTIASDRYHGVWARYLRSEMPAEHPAVTVDHDPGAGTVTVELDQMALPERSDDRRNTVVNFSAPGGMGSVENVDTDTNPEIVVDKPDDSNKYHASMTFLGAQAGYETVEKDVTRPVRHRHPPEWNNWTETKLVENESSDTSGKPMEVTFLLDESGSMANPCEDSPSTCTTRLDQVKDATGHFLTRLDALDLNHRAALVGYSTRYDYYSRVYHRLSSDLDQVDSRVEGLRAEGNTPIGDGIWKARTQYHQDHKSGHEKVIILLTDGKHNAGTSPLPQARGAAREGITIHTVGVGEDVNRGTLKAIARVTGGEHHFVDNASELKDVFNRLLANETTEYDLRRINHSEKVNDSWTHVHRNQQIDRDHQVVRTPVTLEMTVDGTTRTPWVGGGTALDRALNYGAGASRPESAAVDDGDPVHFDATVHDCAAKRHTGEHADHGGHQYNFTECSALGGSLGDGRMYAYTDGEPVPGSGSAWWQRDLADVVPGKYVENGKFDLDSNQVVVVFEFPDNGGTTTDYNNLVFLYEVGDADREVVTDWMLNLQVNVVETDS